MADTFTTNLNLTKPEPGAAEDTWGISLNSDLDTLDAIFSSSGTQVNLNPNQVNFADNKKAIFGTGSDLQIFHDGSNSIIKDAGAGNLELHATNLVFKNADSSLQYASFISGGAAELRYNGSPKLATTSTGIDVTGTVTSDGLTVDGEGRIEETGDAARLVIARTDNANATESASMDLLESNGGGSFGTASNYGFRLDIDGSANTFNIKSGVQTSVTKRFQIGRDTGDISFYDDTGSTQGFFWDASAESLGIGTTSPDKKLDVLGDIRSIDSSSNQHQLRPTQIISYATDAILNAQSTGDDVRLNTQGTTRLIATAEGSVGIGTSSPATNRRLHVVGVAAKNARFERTASGGSHIEFSDSDTTVEPSLGSSGNNLTFHTSFQERARIDSSGNLLVGKTGTTFGNAGIEARENGNFRAIRDGANVADFNRLTSDGNIVAFYKDNTTVGSIGTRVGDLLIGTGNTGLQFYDAGREIIPRHTDGTNIDAAVQLGSAGSRFTDLYLSDAIRGDVKFENNTGTTEYARFDSSGNFGIGTSSPSHKLTVNGDIQIEGNGSGNSSHILYFKNSAAAIQRNNNDLKLHAYNAMIFGVSNTAYPTSVERARIDSSGNFGIGTSSPQNNLHVNAGTGGGVTLEANANVDIDFRYRSGGVNKYNVAYDASEGSLIWYDNTANATRMVLNSSGNVGIGTSSPSSISNYKILEVQGDTTTTGGIYYTSSSDNSQKAHYYIGGGVGYLGTQTNHPFAFTTNNTERARIDSSGNLLVGKTSANIATVGFEATPSSIFQANASTADGKVAHTFNRKTSDGDVITFRKDGTAVGSIGVQSNTIYIDGGSGSTGLYFGSSNIYPRDNGAEVDNAVVIGHASYRFKDLYLSGTANTVTINTAGPTGTGNGIVMAASGWPYKGRIGMNGTSGGKQYWTANYNLNTSSVDSASYYSTYIENSAQNGIIAFGTSSAVNTAPSERARIDSNGALLVGKTIDSLSVAGATLNSGGTAGKVQFVRSGAEPLALNRLSNDGTMLDFRRDGVTHAQIGILSSASGSDAYFASGSSSVTGTGLRFISVTSSIYIAPCRGDGSTSDDLIDLGSSGTRFDDIYATNGTIQTSDRNEKQDIQELSDAEQRVATACKGLIRRYKFNSAVEEKGDDARYHFGIIAQDLQDAFTAEGLDAGDYGMFISDTYTDDNGIEQTRLGVRYNELLAFIIAAI